MKFVIPPSMADAFRSDDGTLPDNVEVWDGRTRAASGNPETWLIDSASFSVLKLRPIHLEKLPQVAEAPTPATFKGKRIAQWKQERRGAR